MTQLLARHRNRDADSGETLIEILLAMVVLGITSIGLIAALSTGVIASDSHRRLSDTEAVTRAYAELVKNRVLHPASTTLTASVAYNKDDSPFNISVASTAVFTDSLPFTIAIDGIPLRVTQIVSATALKVDPIYSSGEHGIGAAVVRYESCPFTTINAAGARTYPNSLLEDNGFTQTAGNRIALPTVTRVQYYSADKTLIATQTRGSGVPSACTDYWKNGPTICSVMNPQEHRTVCDPAWIRATVSVASTDVNSKTRGTSTSTDILFRRVS